MFLGTDKFVDETQCKLRDDQSLNDIPKPQKLAPISPLDDYVTRYSEKEGMARAYLGGLIIPDTILGGKLATCI